MQDILLHLDGGPRTPVLCEIALGLAKRFGASLTALFARTESSRANADSRVPSRHLSAAARHHRAAFTARTAKSGIATQWWQLAHGAPPYVVAQTAFCARYADLVIMGQPDEDGFSPPDLAEEVVAQAGRPVLVIPRQGSHATIGETIAVAWNASREAARAVHDSLPFLSRAQTVKLLTIHGKPGYAMEQEGSPPFPMADHLRRWGFPVEHEHLVHANGGQMDTLLGHASAIGADLLVMGAHGLHGGLLPIRTAATRYMLRHMTMPILLSH